MSDPSKPHVPIDTPEKRMIAALSHDIVASMLGEPKQKPGFKRNGTYYQQHFAEELIPILTAMLEDGQDRMYRYSKFPHLSKQSIFLKISQAYLFLMDELDHTRQWTKMRADLVIRKEPAGVAIRWRKNLRDTLGEPDIVKPEEETLTWRAKLDKFLTEAPDGSKFHEKGLVMTEDEMNDLRISLHDLQGIVAVIKPGEIKVLKLSAEEQKMEM